jgi:hypothetical protein
MMAIGAVIGAASGFVIGGGVGVFLGGAAGGVPALGTTPAAALGGAALGAGLGGVSYDLGQALGNWLNDVANDWMLARKRDLEEIDWVAKRYGLSQDQRRRLHLGITKKGMNREEIEEIAEEIAGERRNSNKGGQCPR